jgi:hypothetical protein
MALKTSKSLLVERKKYLTKSQLIILIQLLDDTPTTTFILNLTFNSSSLALFAYSNPFIFPNIIKKSTKHEEKEEYSCYKNHNWITLSFIMNRNWVHFQP